jgi:hypothetical protein
MNEEGECKGRKIMKETSLKLGFVGDIALTHDYDVLYIAKGPHYPFEFVDSILKNHDVLIGNLESPFCLGGETYPLKLSLRAHPGYAAGLKDAGFTAMTVGNNHILDYREQAFFETLEILDSHGLKSCGAGSDVKEASKPAIIEKKGIAIAVLSCCDVTIDSPFYATEATRGIALLDMEKLESEIKALRREVDIIVISPHWGKEDWRYPLPGQVAKARALIDFGADLVIGHHPHVIQGVERYKNGWIAYSLGNFLFSDIEWRWLNLQGEIRSSQKKQSHARKQTMIFSADVTERGVRDVHLIPCQIGIDLRVKPMDSLHLSSMAMGMLSWPIALHNYNAFWLRYDKLNSFRIILWENAKRLKNIHKLRYSHVREMVDMIRMLINQEPR